MSRGIALAPCGLVIERVASETDRLLLVARPISKTAACPTCSGISARIHSQYQRALADLPSQGRLARIRLWARRTTRLEGIVHHVGLALGGRPGQSIARRLLLPVSKDILLRVVRRNAARSDAAPRVVGIDDWAWKRGHRYGTIICDLEKRRIIDILPDREAATVTTWLAEHPTISVITRDRGAGYIQAATESRPEAIQVADRWHLMENASAAFLTAVQRSMRTIRTAVGAGVVDPTLLSCAERRQHAGWLRRQEENTAILTLAGPNTTPSSRDPLPRAWASSVLRY